METLFVTLVDLSGKSGNHIATRESINAFAKDDNSRVRVICPKPEQDLQNDFVERVDEFFHLQKRPIPTPIYWHIKIQFKLLALIIYHNFMWETDIIVTRMAPSLILPAVISVLIRSNHYLLIRGTILSTVYNPIYSGVGSFNYLLSSLLSDRVYIAFKEVADEIPLSDYIEYKIVEFNNAVDPEKFSPMKKREAKKKVSLNLSRFDLVVGFVGGLAKRHRLGDLLEAAKLVDESGINIGVLIVGEGGQDLQELSQSLGINKSVIFAGHVDHCRVPNYICSCDIMYGVVDPQNPSNPIKNYEYLACERPVIINQKSEFEFVTENNLGILINDVNPKEVSEKLIEFNELTYEDKKEMGKQGRDFVMSHHTWSSLVDIIRMDFESGRRN
jgi:glycosyltransferase involved in cell wall biosynthesis